MWSRGEELVTDKYPEFQEFLKAVPNGTGIDGEILPFGEGEIQNFNTLQTRIGRKNISKALLKKTPVILNAYDLLEWNGEDIRQKPFSVRRKILDEMIQKINSEEIGIYLSETMSFETWEEATAERDLSREKRSEGLMLKRKDSPYLVGRKKGDWWKWKIDPFTIDAVLTYAMRGHGRRANLYTDYTFALWDEGELVTFAKAYSGLTDAEFRQVDAWIKRNTLERFGQFAVLRHITFLKSPLKELRKAVGIKVELQPDFQGFYDGGKISRLPRRTRYQILKHSFRSNFDRNC